MNVMVALQMVNNAGVPTLTLSRIESAIVRQVNHDVNRYWKLGDISFRRQGLKVFIVRHLRPGWAGVHSVTNGVPYAKVLAWQGMSITASHEIIEMLANREICDPVQYHWYQINGVAVSDFVTPSWYDRRAGPWDWMRILHHLME